MLREATERGSRGVRSAARAALAEPTDVSNDLTARTALYDELLRRFASGVRAAQLYAADHPLLTATSRACSPP